MSAKLTKAARQAIARQARRFGYFHGDTELWVNCPECKEKVATVHSVHAGTVAQQLDSAMHAHLLDDCAKHQPEDTTQGAFAP